MNAIYDFCVIVCRQKRVTTCSQLGTVAKSSRRDTRFEIFCSACPYKTQRGFLSLAHNSRFFHSHCHLHSFSDSQSCSLPSRSLSLPSFLLQLWPSPSPLQSPAVLTQRPSSLALMFSFGRLCSPSPMLTRPTQRPNTSPLSSTRLLRSSLNSSTLSKGLASPAVAAPRKISSSSFPLRSRSSLERLALHAVQTLVYCLLLADLFPLSSNLFRWSFGSSAGLSQNC